MWNDLWKIGLRDAKERGHVRAAQQPGGALAVAVGKKVYAAVEWRTRCMLTMPTLSNTSMT